MIDLGIGSTDLLHEVLNKHIKDIFVESDILSGMPYNKNGPLQFVIDTIHSIHNKYHPGLIKPTTKIVVGSGASQLISCFFYLNKNVTIQSPFWFRLPIMSSMHNSKLTISNQTNPKDLITYPNNPDGKMILGNKSSDWYDAVYLWPWYMDMQQYKSAVQDLANAPKKAVVFSLSKMTGHCGVRFGWAIVDDDDLYSEICDYMEYESGGLGYDTQLKTEEIMNNILTVKNWENALIEVGEILSNRKKDLLEVSKIKNWQYDSNPGMFAWITTKDDHVFHSLNDLNIKSTPGSKCGGLSNQIRLNLAVSTDTWDGFLKIIKPQR